MKKNFAKISSPGDSKFKSIIKFASFVLTKPGFNLVKKLAKKTLIKLGLRNEYFAHYDEWIKTKLDPAVLKKEFSNTFGSLQNRPKISIIVPVFDPNVEYLHAAINSVTGQSYENWELCLSDDCSPNPQIKILLEQSSRNDNRIKVIFREKNGHISANSNSALSLATGDYLLFMDHDDLLTPNCLFEFVKHINAHPSDQLIYSDEDKVDDKGEFSSPHFKPDWAPDNLLSRNYIGHVLVIRKDLMGQVKGFREGFEGSQDYDFLLRATELTSQIGHIPIVLYHWRIHELSVAAHNSDVKPYAYIAAKKALEEALIRRDTPGTVEDIPDTLGGYQLKYKIKSFGKVSIIIPTKDHVKLLKTAIDSILQKTNYPDYEIIVLNNNSVSKEFFDLVKEYEDKYAGKFRCIDATFPFNFAKLMNLGAAESKGEYLLMCNNDVEVIKDDWMAQMVSYAQREKTGAIGVKLLYKDNTIQHAGIILGLGGAAGHVFTNIGRYDRGYFNYVRLLNNYAAVTGACMMCRKSVYNEVGGMDERLEVEWNDVDLCLQFLKHGYYNVYLPTVELYHYESATRGHPFQSKQAWAQHEKDRAIFRNKWQEQIDNDPFYNPNLSVECTNFQLKSNTMAIKENNMSKSKKYLEIIIIFIVILITFLYRRYDAFTNPQLWAEAGTEILKGWDTNHFGSIFTIYAGYLMTVQRIIACIIGILQINYFYIPLAYNLSALLVTFLVAVGLWYSALRLNIKHRILYATLFVLLPVGNELYMEEASLQWITGIYLLNYLFVWSNKEDEKYYFLTLVMLFIFSTSGPYAGIVSPVILLMIFLNRKEVTLKRLAPLLVILTGGMIQLFCIKFIQPWAYGGRVASWDSFEKDDFHLMKLFTKNISQMLYFNSGRLPDMSDNLKTVLSLLVLIVLIIFFIISYRKIENKKKYIPLLSAALCFGSFIFTYWPKESKILSLEISRYYFLPYTCIGWLLIVAWDKKIKIYHILLYVTFLLLHSGYIRTSLPDKKWKEQVKEYYEGKRDTIEINPPSWKVVLPKREK